MLPRERVIKVIRHEEPDRIPTYGWVAANLTPQIAEAFGSVQAFEDRYEFDFAHIFGGPNTFVREAVEALSAFYYNDLIFTGPMAGAPRVVPAVAAADAFLATSVFNETKELPKDPNHPLLKLFPEFAEQLKVAWEKPSDLAKL